MPHADAATRTASDSDPEPAEQTITRLRQEVEELREEILKLRDALVAKDAQRAAALGRAAELESWALRYDGLIAHHEAVLDSTSWRTSQRILAPLRWVRGARSR